ncbi:hypothetical protein Zmor_025105 [Zophobas morio]|uniref:Uncharacterized protein n=1 Tax=Zophobas morio TaxID=2755281 RepID=A0AA38M3S6_9CUCU|nr:hypothetical protein Zmor_025105 [Zophobas morio]
MKQKIISKKRNLQKISVDEVYEKCKKTTPTSSISESKPKRIPSVLKDKKQPSKECGRATVKGGRTSPVVRPPVHPRAPAKPVPKVAEALAVLVQHLVFNVEAYQVPVLKKQVQKLRNETDEFRATSLIAENKKLYENFKEEINQNKRLCQHNEELKWKLKQNKEVVSKVLEQAAEESHFSRSFLSSSFNERHLSSNKQSLERALSFREKNSDRSWKSDLSPPSSPKVKGVVEKSDSVSYVLDLDESPDVVASRIVRRSFRNSTPPKTTPTKSPSNKRPRMKFPLSLSASASAILPSNSSRSRNGEFDGESAWVTSTPKRQDDDLDLDLDEDDLKLPALPSEMGRKNGAQALPSPKHLAGEAMISESNSEDESTSSSSVQL